MKLFLILPLILLLLIQTVGAEDRIQFRSLDFTKSIIELHNFGDAPVSLSGWQFCTHDENQVRHYSDPSGLNGRSIAAGESLFIYWKNDAPAEDTHTINRNSIGGSFSEPLDRGPYGMQLYINGNFGDGNSIADHWQWSQGGVDNDSADERSDEAESGGVWTDQSQWISTGPETVRIVLNDTTGARLHGPSSYDVIEIVPLPPEFLVTAFSFDPEGNAALTWEDLSDFGVTSYTVQTSPDLSSWTGAGNSETNSLSLPDIVDFPAFFRVVVE